MSFKEGDKIKTLKSFKANGLIHFSAPVTGSFKCKILADTVFEIVGEPREGYPGFYVVPENRREFETLHVPAEDRESPKYGGFSFLFMKLDLGKKYEFII